MKPKCLSKEYLLRAAEGVAGSTEMMAADAHMEQCPACEEAYLKALTLDMQLRREVVQVKLQAGSSDIEALTLSALERIRSASVQEVHASFWTEHLLHALTPLCGQRLTRQSIHLASKASFRSQDVERVSEQEWHRFIAKLGSILSEVCGATVKNAVHHLSLQALAGAV